MDLLERICLVLHDKLLVNKPRNLTFPRKIRQGLRRTALIWDFEKSSQNANPFFARKSQILRFIYQELDLVFQLGVLN